MLRNFQIAQPPNLRLGILGCLPVVVASGSAKVDVVECGVDRKVRRLLDDQGPLGEGQAEAGQRSVPALVCQSTTTIIRLGCVTCQSHIYLRIFW